MLVKGRSPTVRHVSRTDRVALGWLFDRINLEPKIQIKFVDTKNQLAEILTKGSFSRNEWNHLLRLFNIMSFSMFSCSHFCDVLSDPIGKQSAKSKSGQEATSSEGSPMAKPKPMVPAKARPLNLVARSPWSEKNSSQNYEYSINPGNADERKEVGIASGNSLQTASKSEVGYSQVSRQESALIAEGDLCMEQHKNNVIREHLLTPTAQGNLWQGCDSKTRVSKHEIHEPSTHDQDLPVLTKETWELHKRAQFSQWKH